jgi:hypothetical protein
VFLPWPRLLLCVYLLFLVWAEGTALNPADPDLWHRLALGEALWKTHHFPDGDAFSYLADYHQIADHEWGSALTFYGLYEGGDGSAMVGLKLVTLGLTLMLLVWAGLQARAPTLLLAAFYALVLLALLPSFQSTVRCMTFTHIFFALWLYWFQCERHGRSIPTWAYVLTVILWANLHGGFAIGLAWLFGVTLIQLAKGVEGGKWAGRFALCTLATLVNPYGWRLWLSTGRALLTTRRGFDEWAPVSWLHEPGAYPGYKLLLLVVVAALVALIWTRGWRRIDRSATLLIGAALVLSLTSARHTSLFAAVAGALLPDVVPVEPTAAELSQPIRRLSYMALCFLLVLMPLYTALIVLPGEGLQLQEPANSCPVAAVDYLLRHEVRGRLLVPFNYGSYALWRLRGRMRVSMDGRYDLVYRPETYQRVEDFFFDRPRGAGLLRGPKPDAILLPRADPVYPKLQTNPQWSEVYRDGTDAVFRPR